MLLRRCATIVAVPAIFLTCLAAAQTKGTFQAGINYPAGPATISSNTGYLFGGIMPVEAHTRDSKGNTLDFNGDGKPDIVVAASCSAPTLPAGSGSAGIPGCPATGAAVVVYLGNGDGTFQPALISPGVAGELRSIAIGDFNGDGKLDVAAASDCLSSQDCSSGSMTILLGNGDGTFMTGGYYPLNGIVSRSNTITIGDLNGDGRQDVIVTLACAPVVAPCQGAVSVYLGNGDGTFQSPNSYPTAGNSGIPVVLGDFNKDGKQDVLVANPQASTLTFFPGNGDGSLGIPAAISVPANGQALAAADFNSDGNLDVVIAQNVGPATLLYGNGDGTFQPPVTVGTGLGNAVTDGASIAVVDLNGDGKPDLILSGTLDGFNGAAVFLNDGAGNLVAGETYTAGGWLYAPIDVGDFNGDGKNDLIVVSGCPQDYQINNNCPDGTLSVLLGTGNGTLRSTRYLDTTSPNLSQQQLLSVAAADLNADGFQDLVYPACSTTECGFALLLADGAGGYQPPIIFGAPVGGEASFISVADFNGDGKPDVAVFNTCDASCTAASVSIFLNTGNGTFSSPALYQSGGATPLTILKGDFNGDGKLDIAVLQSDPSTGENLVGILLGNGDGTFNPVVTTPAGPNISVSSFAASDFNQDGKTDLVLAENNNNPSDPYDSSAQILLSNGDGTFTFGQLYGSGGGSGSVTTGDVNGDGKPDLILGNRCEQVFNGTYYSDLNCANGSIGVLLGNGDGTFQPVQTQIVTDGNLWAISLADVNGDGKSDVIASTSTGVAVSFGNGDGSFQPPTIYAALQVTQNVQLAIADLNGDGGLDIVQPGTNGQLAILYNQGFSNPRPTVRLQSSVNPSTYGQQVTLTATLTSASGVPTGTVMFTDGTTTLGSATLTNGNASISTATLPSGTHSIVASYAGDTNNLPATSAALAQVVSKASTAITIFTGPNPSYPNQTVFFQPSIISQFGGPVAGTVTFKQGTTTLAVLTYSHPYITTYATIGTRQITAIYSGDQDNLGSTSAIVKQVVSKVPTTVAVTSSEDPSTFGDTITLTATVTPSNTSLGLPSPSGIVTFKEGTTILALDAPVSSGVATLTMNALGAGKHNITAYYAGDTNYLSSAGKLNQVVNGLPTATSLSADVNPSAFGQVVTFTATVGSSRGIPIGIVTFKSGTSVLARVPLSGGIANYSTSALTVGVRSVTAVYSAGFNFAASVSNVLAQFVNKASTSTALVSSANPCGSGQSVTFTATVSPQYSGTATGSITFRVGAKVLKTVTLSGGSASYTTSTLPTGSDKITATYSGSGNLTGSSGLITQQVN